MESEWVECLRRAARSPQTDLPSQEATAGGAARARACLRTALADGVPSPRGGRDKPSVWAEIRWEQTPVRLTDCK